MPARWLPAALFLGFFAGMGWPACAEEPPAKRFRIGIVAPAPVAFDTAWVAVEKELRARGYVEGKNLDIDFLLLGNDAETYPAAMAKLARHDENAILIRAPEPALRAAIATTRSVPLVIVAVSYDPLASGYINSLAHPGGNVTGVFLENVELAAKRIDLLKQAASKTARLVVLYDAAGKYQLDPLQSAASVLGLSLDAVELRDTPYDYERALAQTDGARGDAMMTLTSPVLFHDRERLAEIALEHRLPAIGVNRDFAIGGYLMSYGPDYSDMFRLAADYIDEILKGAKPADLPVQQPTKFELVVNGKAANALGLTVPQVILGRADEVIE
jgi:putative tryptophan/tyrosine transport system substrate-binding protein